MSIIDMTKALARALQQEESYQEFIKAKEACDEDEALQNLIGEFNLKRMDLNNEMNKPQEESDQEKLDRLNNAIRSLYDDIMASESMARFNFVRNELDVTVNQMVEIITQASNGVPVDEIDFSECTHDCSTCGGCH